MSLSILRLIDLLVSKIGYTVCMTYVLELMSSDILRVCPKVTSDDKDSLTKVSSEFMDTLLCKVSAEFMDMSLCKVISDITDVLDLLW